jgi:hypothetical protein
MCAEIVDVMLAASFCRPAIKNDFSAFVLLGYLKKPLLPCNTI